VYSVSATMMLSDVDTVGSEKNPCALTVALAIVKSMCIECSTCINITGLCRRDEHRHRHGKRARFRNEEDTGGGPPGGSQRHGRGKRLRREPSAASITMLFSEHKKSAEEHVKRMESVETDTTPEYVRNEVTKAVYQIKNAKPVGGKAHLAAVHGLRHILSTCRSIL
jgi:hypothetical protein